MNAFAGTARSGRLAALRSAFYFTSTHFGDTAIVEHHTIIAERRSDASQGCVYWLHAPPRAPSGIRLSTLSPFQYGREIRWFSLSVRHQESFPSPVHRINKADDATHTTPAYDRYGYRNTLVNNLISVIKVSNARAAYDYK